MSTKYPDAIKCSSIYLKNTSSSLSTTEGYISGGTIGSGGINVGGGSLDATTKQESSSILAQIFKPVENTLTYNANEAQESDFLGKMGMIAMIWIAGFGAEILIRGMKNDIGAGEMGQVTNQISSNFSPIFMILAIILTFVLLFAPSGKSKTDVFKYTDEDMRKIKENYDKVYYSEKENVIFINENHVVSANRENFEVLLKGS